KKACKKTQIIVTTHSKQLVDAFTYEPDRIIICEKENGVTQFKRLNEEELRPWLEEYSLGSLWERGDLGGNLW
ncbi:MAG: hypothetical protein K2N67_00080, partial [Mucispirillum sp.]|nr:hypothetical protein [Mucispirillum sp.]